MIQSSKNRTQIQGNLLEVTLELAALISAFTGVFKDFDKKQKGFIEKVLKDSMEGNIKRQGDITEYDKEIREAFYDLFDDDEDDEEEEEVECPLKALFENEEDDEDEDEEYNDIPSERELNKMIFEALMEGLKNNKKYGLDDNDKKGKTPKKRTKKAKGE